MAKKRTNNFSSKDEIPEVLGENGFSIDVLVYFPKLDEHSIGWFQYSSGTWFFLSNQDYKNELFFWRYFENTIDIPVIWKEVEGYKGFYKISSDGRVYSEHKQKLLIPFPTGKGGYLKVRLCRESSQKDFSVSRLVALHFKKNINNYPEVNHIDEDVTNNNYWNLEWCTRKYNVNFGNRTKKASESNKKSIIRYDVFGGEWEYDGIIDVKKDGYIPSCVQRCCSGERRTHKGFMWKYNY